VFWCHHEMRFNGSNIDHLRARAEAVGLVTWPAQRYPTSTYTHDAMLERYGIKRHSLHFQHMAEPELALYANTYRLHERLMKPWVRCALDVDCLAPFGAQVINVTLLMHYFNRSTVDNPTSLSSLPTAYIPHF